MKEKVQASAKRLVSTDDRLNLAGQATTLNVQQAVALASRVFALASQPTEIRDVITEARELKGTRGRRARHPCEHLRSSLFSQHFRHNQKFERGAAFSFSIDQAAVVLTIPSETYILPTHGSCMSP